MPDSDSDSSRRRKTLIMGGSSSLLILLIAGVVATVYISSEKPEPPATSTSSTLQTSSKSVEMMCSSTDYADKCQSSLSKIIKSDNADPKALVEAAIEVLFDEAEKGFNKSQHIQTEDPRVRGAIDDCRELFMSSKDEMERSLLAIVDKGIDHLPEQSDNVRAWLSAVMSYQQTCVDGFPEGDTRNKLEEAMKDFKEMTSNALAIVGKASNFLTLLNLDGLMGGRRLLGAEDEEPVGSDGGFPTWVGDGDRRTLLQDGKNIVLTPNVTVAQDGSGQFKTISSALDAMPKKYQGRYNIYIKPGVYVESFNVTKNMENVTMYGDTAEKTIITGSKNFVDGTRTFQTATVAVMARSFMAIRLTFRNSAGAEKHQAVAIRVQADQAIFLFCHMEGYQDTLYAQSLRQFYRSCVISGTIDFIFGDAAAVFQNCVLVVRRPLSNQQNIVTAQGRIDRQETTGFVLHRCRIVPESNLKPADITFKSYMGRPWKENSRIIIMESEIGSLIVPEGYMPWEGTFGLQTLSYTEYNNVGPRSDFSTRVKWPGVKQLTKEEAQRFTVINFIQGAEWIRKIAPGIEIPVRMGLYN